MSIDMRNILSTIAAGVVDGVLSEQQPRTDSNDDPHAAAYAQQVNRLAQQVGAKMVQVERGSGIIEPSVCELYGNWILSIPACIESILRSIIHLVILLVSIAY
jgi:hypothetical protein